jgi:hypothetical protein
MKEITYRTRPQLKKRKESRCVLAPPTHAISFSNQYSHTPDTYLLRLPCYPIKVECVILEAMGKSHPGSALIARAATGRAVSTTRTAARFRSTEGFNQEIAFLDVSQLSIKTSDPTLAAAEERIPNCAFSSKAVQMHFNRVSMNIHSPKYAVLLVTSELSCVRLQRDHLAL